MDMNTLMSMIECGERRGLDLAQDGTSYVEEQILTETGASIGMKQDRLVILVLTFMLDHLLSQNQRPKPCLTIS